MTNNINENNKLNLKKRTNVRILKLEEGIIVAVPTLKAISDARILDVNEDGSFTAHWNENWNESGDFRTELMRFDNNLIFDNGDKEKRNKIRKNNNLIEII